MSRDTVQSGSGHGGQPPAAPNRFGLARELESRAPEVVAAAFRRLRATAAGSGGEEVATAFLEFGVAEQTAGFARDVVPERFAILEAAPAREIARAGDLGLLLDAARSIRAELWSAWLGLVDASGATAEGRDELLRVGADFFSRCSERLEPALAELFRRETERRSRSGEQRRLDLARIVLDGGSLQAAPVDLELDRHHLGVIAWGEGAEAAIRELGSALGRPVFVIGPLAGSWWAWLSAARPLDRYAEGELSRFAPKVGEGRLAVGLEGHGEGGFRATNRQALRARRVAAEDTRGVHFADVAVAALAAENDEDARAFVAHELRGIDDDSTASRRIRETLIAYFATGHNAASAAASLGVHQQTVANRLRSAEDRLGRPVDERRLELDTALRLRRGFGKR